jgi:hypothetical protein
MQEKHSLHTVNEHFEAILNDAVATQIVFQQPVRVLNKRVSNVTS